MAAVRQRPQDRVHGTKEDRALKPVTTRHRSADGVGFPLPRGTGSQRENVLNAGAEAFDDAAQPWEYPGRVAGHGRCLPDRTAETKPRPIEGQPSIASSSSMKPAIIDRPLSQNFGSLASRPKGASRSLWCIDPPAFSMAKYFS